MTIATIGIDIAKSVFQLHGFDEAGTVVLRKKLRRSAVLDTLRKLEPCLVGMEACATAHYWAREISALGHEVKLMPPAYVKPYVKRQKNDMADAEAICEAVTRPNMRFVPIKSADGQAVLVLHRSRDLLMRQRTMLLNAGRGHLAEFGLIAPQGPRRMLELIAQMREGAMHTCRTSLEWRFWGSVGSSTLWHGRSMRSSDSYSPGTAAMRPARDWRPFLALGSSPPRRSPLAYLIHPCSAPGVSSPPSSG